MQIKKEVLLLKMYYTRIESNENILHFDFYILLI